MTEDKQCPVCHKMNRRLDLKETDGWMECIHCGAITKALDFQNIVKIPFMGIVHC